MSNRAEEKILNRVEVYRVLHLAVATAATAALMVIMQPVFASEANAGTNAKAVQPAVGDAVMIHAQMRVVGIDTAANSVTLRGPRGNVATVAVDPEVANVKDLTVGDKLAVTYQDALLVRADKVATDGIRERTDTTDVTRAAGGVVTATHKVQVIATIQKIDPKRRLVTLRGPWRTETFQASRDIELAKLRVGDSVEAEFVSATAVELKRDDAAGAAGSANASGG